MLTVEDHWAEGGIGEAVFAAIAEEGLAVTGKSLAVRHMPGSATPDEELADAGIDAAGDRRRGARAGRGRCRSCRDGRLGRRFLTRP